MKGKLEASTSEGTENYRKSNSVAGTLSKE